MTNSRLKLSVVNMTRQLNHNFGVCSKLYLCSKNVHPDNIIGSRSTAYDYDRNYNSQNTIFALSSGGRRCAVSVIRVSGPNSKHAMQMLCGHITKPRMASVCKLFHPVTQDLLDKTLVIWFPGPKSFTGEDCAEFHVHGGLAVVSSVLSALSTVPGLKPAEPGEFSKRAFINGKLDLTEAEGLGDLIHAETDVQRKQALRQMEGDLGHLYSQWRTTLIKALANVEAFIDFSEEDNIEDNIIESVSAGVGKIQSEIAAHLRDSRQGERLRNGLSVVILGEPNVGKSSLLNALCQRPAAIVSPIPGTTRDIVETALEIAGYPVLISDTAGLRDTCDSVEREGINRALASAQNADLKILVLDWLKHGENLLHLSISKFVTEHLTTLGLNKDLHSSHDEQMSESITHHPFCRNLTAIPISPVRDNSDAIDVSDILVVVNKSDLVETSWLTQVSNHTGLPVTCISCQTGEGVDKLLSCLVDKIKHLCGDPLVQSSSLTQTRHRHHLTQCLHHLMYFDHVLASDVVLAAERLRRAARELALITGKISVEDVLDVIFRDFCIGK